MDFADRTILVGLVALAIPLMVHLLGRRRARRMMLPTMRFAEVAHQASRGWVWLRRAGLLALRLAAVALLVAAIAGPRAAPCQSPNDERPGGTATLLRGRGCLGESSHGHAEQRGRATHQLAVTAIVVDAAGQEAARVRSADLVAAAFAGETAGVKQVIRCTAAEFKIAAVPAAARHGGETPPAVIFWVGSQAPADGKALEEFLARGGGLVWMPAEASPPDDRLARVLGVRFAGIGDVRAGITIDPAGYVSDLLGAFEGGTSGDLGAPVFARRLLVTDGGGDLIRFRDGQTAIIDRCEGAGRIVVLAAGPAPAWGDLAGRAEFVVLMHSLVEALAPVAKLDADAGPFSRDSKRSASLSAAPPGAATAPGDLTGWFVLALAAVLAAEGWLAAVSTPRLAVAANGDEH